MNDIIFFLGGGWVAAENMPKSRERKNLSRYHIPGSLTDVSKEYIMNVCTGMFEKSF
jgi:hypothetical protein